MVFMLERRLLHHPEKSDAAAREVAPAAERAAPPQDPAEVEVRPAEPKCECE